MRYTIFNWFILFLFSGYFSTLQSGEILTSAADLTTKQKWSDLSYAGHSDLVNTASKTKPALQDSMPEIYNSLGLIEYKKTDHRIILFEKTLGFARLDHKSKAIRYFKKALKLNPNYIDAHYNLGKTYLAKGSSKDLKQAEQAFNYILKKTDQYKDTNYLLGQVFQQKKEYTKAIQIFQNLAQSKQKDGRESIRLAQIYYQINTPELASGSYFKGLELLKDKLVIDEIYASIKMLISKAGKEEYEVTPYAKKAWFFKKFWKHRDPSPGTILNERLIEHFRRVDFAKIRFPFTAPPFYDDRGKIYIKYGEPRAFFSRPIVNLIVRGNESWSYEHIQEGLIFDFVEEGGVFRLVQDFQDACLPDANSDARLLAANTLYLQRSHLSPTYSKLAMRVDEAGLLQFRKTRIKALIKAPSEFYLPDPEAKPLPLLCKWSQFKGEEDSTKIVFYFAVPAKTLNFIKTKDKYKSDLDYTLVALDSLYDEIYKYQSSTPLLLPSLKNVKHVNFIFKNQLQVLPGECEIQLRAQSQKSKRLSVVKQNIIARDFKPDGLALSDLLPAASIVSLTEDSSRQFTRNDLKIIPYPFNSIIRENPIYIYYEIYNLNYNINGQVEYEVQYSVQTLQTEKSVWAKTKGFLKNIFSAETKNSIRQNYSKTGTNINAAEYNALDLSNFEPGITRLEIVVTDLTSNISVNDTLDFKVTR